MPLDLLNKNKLLILIYHQIIFLLWRISWSSWLILEKLIVPILLINIKRLNKKLEKSLNMLLEEPSLMPPLKLHADYKILLINKIFIHWVSSVSKWFLVIFLSPVPKQKMSNGTNKKLISITFSLPPSKFSTWVSLTWWLSLFNWSSKWYILRSWWDLFPVGVIFYSKRFFIFLSEFS